MKEKTKILWSGITGKTGQLALKLEKDSDLVTIVAGVSNSNSEYYNYDELDDIKEDFDVIVDFSYENNLPKILRFALQKHKPLVIGTYIKSEEYKTMLEEASKIIPIFKGRNFRFKVKKFIDDVIEYAKNTEEDIHLIETHYKTKKVPSQTALEVKERVFKETGKQVSIESRLEYDELINDWQVNHFHCRVQGIDELVPDIFKVASRMSYDLKPGFYNLNALLDQNKMYIPNPPVGKTK